MLNEKDIQLLMDGLDALIKYEDMSDSMGSLIGAIMLKPEDRDDYAAEQEAKRAGKEAERRVFSERIILLKAKLIHMKDKAFAENAM